MKKQATNMTKLLARVGRDLSGATPRELKFLAKRGITKGFKLKDIKKLKAEGHLPDNEHMLKGFNKGTEGILRTSPVDPIVGFGLPYAEPAEIVKVNHGYSYHPFENKVLIPDVDAKGTMKERLGRALSARHEAQERIRSLASELRRPMVQYNSEAIVRDIGTTHYSGVMHDERVATNSLLRSLGLKGKWERGQNLFAYSEGRSPRELYIGSKPLNYEYKLWRSWQDQMNKGMRGARKVYSIISEKGDVAELLDGVVRRNRALKELHEPWLKKIQDASTSYRLVGTKAVRAYDILRDNRPFTRNELLAALTSAMVPRRVVSGTGGQAGFNSLRRQFMDIADKYVPSVSKDVFGSEMSTKELQRALQGDQVLFPTKEIRRVQLASRKYIPKKETLEEKKNRKAIDKLLIDVFGL